MISSTDEELFKRSGLSFGDELGLVRFGSVVLTSDTRKL